MSGFAAFFIAVGVVSSIFFVLMLRTDRIRDRRRAYADSSTGDTTVISSGNESFGLLSWFSGTSSSSSSDDSCSSSSSSSFSGGDLGCSSDEGGGGDGGGGGGD
jgi:hypothetical protein